MASNNIALECPVCSEQYDLEARAPHAFPCIHNVCRSCLTSLTKKATNSDLACPTCRRVSNTAELPVNYALRDVISLVVPRVAASMACEECDETASHYCAACPRWMCDDHTNIHKKSKLTNTHKLQTTAEEKASRSTSPSMTNKTKCPQHPDMILTLFCQEHDLAICDRCGMLNHKPCTIHDLQQPELMAKQRQELEGLVKSAQQRATLAHELKACLETDHQAIADYFNGEIKKLVDQRDALLEKEHKMASQVTTSIEEVCHSLTLTASEVLQLMNGNQLPRLLAIKPRIKASLSQGDEEKMQVFKSLKLALNHVAQFPPAVTKPSTARREQLFRHVNLPTSSFVRKWGFQGSGDGQLSCPAGVALSGDHLYVADQSNHRISVFRTNGTLVRKWGSSGQGDGQLSNPQAVSVSGDMVFVADYSNHRICVFRTDGTFMRKWGTQGQGDGQLYNPSGVAASGDLVYVADTNNHRICVFNANGTFMRKWGSNGNADGQLSSPAAITVAGDKVHVSEMGNHRISVFNVDGSFVRKWGSSGQGDGQLSYPRGVAVVGDKVSVCDYNNNRVCVFRADGTFLRKWGSQGQGDGQLSSPWGVAASDDLTIYISEYGNHRISAAWLLIDI